MTLIGAGLSHRTSPIEERERFALSTLELPAAMAHLRLLRGPSPYCTRNIFWIIPISFSTGA